MSKVLDNKLKGYKTWKNPKNGFSIAELHYTADPNKDNAEYVTKSKIGMPSDKWNREVDNQWTKSSGEAVYGKEFNQATNILPEDYQPIEEIELIRGWDFGFNQCCVIAQVVGRTVYIIEEIIAKQHFNGERNVGTIRFAPFVKEYCDKYYPNYGWHDVVDPAGFNKSESTETAAVDVMRKFGFSPIGGERLFENRRNAVLKLLTTNDGGFPCLRLKSDCHISIDGFMGAYQYPEKVSVRSVQRLDRPLKNIFSHVQDCIQYVCVFARDVAEEESDYGTYAPIPQVHYGFLEDEDTPEHEEPTNDSFITFIRNWDE